MKGFVLDLWHARCELHFSSGVIQFSTLEWVFGGIVNRKTSLYYYSYCYQLKECDMVVYGISNYRCMLALGINNITYSISPKNHTVMSWCRRARAFSIP